MSHQFFDALDGLDFLGHDINSEAHAKGFYDAPRTFGDVIALVHSELSEALEEFRDGHATNEIYFKLLADYEWRGSDGVEYMYAEGDHINLQAYNALISLDPTAIRFLKPEGVPIELADALIRLLDTFCDIDVSTGTAVRLKMAFNQTRPYKHGKAHL